MGGGGGGGALCGVPFKRVCSIWGYIRGTPHFRKSLNGGPGTVQGFVCVYERQSDRLLACSFVFWRGDGETLHRCPDDVTRPN